MNPQPKFKTEAATRILEKADPTTPALFVTGPISVSVKAGTIFAGVAFEVDTPVEDLTAGLDAGCDYVVTVEDGTPCLSKLTGIPDGNAVLGGFHFAPGGCATARSGGGCIPAINPHSIWDRNFRPACPDPRGMTHIPMPGGKFWCDIYLCAADHLNNGTSQFGVTIADGNDPPQNPAGGRYRKFNYEAAVAVMAHHGKKLLGAEESFAAYIGGTERTSLDSDPKITGLDALRTSRWGVMQPFGAMWQWGTDGDPDTPRASLFGGSWWIDGHAGSRCANVACNWPGLSDDVLGARGRGDHLELV